MGKALHDYFYVSNGSDPIKLYSKEDVTILVDAANNHIERQNGKESSSNDIPPMLALDAFIHSCMEEYFVHGVSENLLEMLNTNLQNVSNQCLIERVEAKLVAVYVAYIPFNPSQRVFAAYMFSNIASLGGLEGLKRCQSLDCRNFFIGRSNVKWCNKSCGSRSRVKKMRNKQ